MNEGDVGSKGGRRPPTRGERATAKASARTGSRAKRLLFWSTALVVTVAAVGLLVSRLAGPPTIDASAVQVRVSMAGVAPTGITVKAGQPFRIELASTDTAEHSDGGGVHEFAIAELGIDWKVGPLSSNVFTATAPRTPGTYTYYCNVCCGGKANPTMRGTLTVS